MTQKRRTRRETLYPYKCSVASGSSLEPTQRLMDRSCVGKENVNDVGDWYAYQLTKPKPMIHRMISDSPYATSPPNLDILSHRISPLNLHLIYKTILKS